MKLLNDALGSRPVGQLQFADLRDFLGQLPSYNQEQEMATMLSTLTNWLEEQDFALPEQGLHRRMKGYELVKPWPGGRLGAALGVRTVGEHPSLLGPEDIPSHAHICAAGRFMPTTTRWGRHMWELELLLNTAAYTATRLGEVLAFDCDDVFDRGATLRVVKQTDEAVAGPILFVPTKGRTCRMVPVLEVTPMGFELWEQLWRRALQARAERRVGRNPRGLLFPCTNGATPWRRSNLRNRHFYRAIGPLGANWPMVVVGERRRFRWTFHTLRHAGATYLLREVYANSGRPVQPDEAALLTGHDDVNTLMRFYVEQTSQARANLVQALADTAERTRAELAAGRKLAGAG